ncbi:MAG: 50S ribosomal protein L29 [Candidatus Vogelbacteria bacterium RIFOXYD1_FULL_44_32]|uniref:Large ribosomal subunit protein uL29 n=1 Tax=Candidatus Vogelbacteria bacterium RIFOXYD1_FULL_44_32 TaxID=1802438 RepID=A0A1G2QDY5_9BACT|nr:MAG: 50S ribosomal protein L29 [Candidatus Vogelbacteria bacterium RIFOXYD1_FULL_44_32]
MDTKDLRKKSEVDLKKLLQTKREALLAFRFGVAGAKTKDVKEGRNTRKVVARILTILRESQKKAKV